MQKATERRKDNVYICVSAQYLIIAFSTGLKIQKNENLEMLRNSHISIFIFVYKRVLVLPLTVSFSLKGKINFFYKNMFTLLKLIR